MRESSRICGEVKFVVQFVGSKIICVCVYIYIYIFVCCTEYVYQD
jgi:hypothetical protein